MGRAGRVAPRICSTLELRTHTSSLTVSLPATASKEVPASPPSPGTPVQEHAPACVRPALQAWPQEALQVVQRQMEALRSQSSEVSEPSTRKRELECSESQEPNSTLQEDSFEEALQTQSALPEDWEQFLNLKTGQFYYFHWSSCKRAKQDPRMLVRQADVTVQAHLLGAHIRGELSIEPASPASDETDSTNEAGSSPPDVCERTSGVCSVAPERCADRELGNDGSMCGSSDKGEQATNVCEKEDRKKPEYSHGGVWVSKLLHVCYALLVIASVSELWSQRAFWREWHSLEETTCEGRTQALLIVIVRKKTMTMTLSNVGAGSTGRGKASQRRFRFIRTPSSAQVLRTRPLSD